MNRARLVVSATTNYANVAGKVLIFYGYGTENDLEWTRTASGAWTSAVLEANPKASTGSASDRAGTSDGGGFGGSDLKSGVIGAVIGAVVAILFLMMKKRRQA